MKAAFRVMKIYIKKIEHTEQQNIKAFNLLAKGSFFKTKMNVHQTTVQLHL